MKQTVEYSASVDALYIHLSDEPVRDTREIEPGIMLDYNEAGQVIGVEILDFQARLHPSPTLEDEAIPAGR